MKPLFLAALVGVLTAGSPCDAQSPFDGTWRPDPQRPGPNQPNDVIRLSDGEYECPSCTPPYRVKADGIPHPVAGNPRYDAVSVQVVDDRRITKTANKNGSTVLQSNVEVSPDGQALTEREIISDAGSHPVDFTSHSS